MGRPSQATAEEKVRTVVAVLQGVVTAVEAARRQGVSEQTIHNWKATFLDGGRVALESHGRPRRPRREVELEVEVDALSRALGAARVQLRVLEKGPEQLPPSRTSR